MRSFAIASVVIACGSRARFEETVAPPDDAGADSSLQSADAHMCGPRCSQDLRQRLDCDGAAIATCEVDTACDRDSGQCSDACVAYGKSSGSLGCDFLAMAPGPANEQSCYAVVVANTWPTAAKLTVDRAGAPIDVAAFAYEPIPSGNTVQYKPLGGDSLAAGKVAILFLGDDAQTCPVKAAVKDAGVKGTKRGHAFHVTSSRPIAAWDIFPFGGGKSAIASATMLYPTSSWGTNYVATSAFDDLPNQYSKPRISFIASAATTLTILPTDTITGGSDVMGANKNQPASYQLGPGETITFEQDKYLSGSIVAATSPVALVAGHACSFYPRGVGACDGMHQQIPPIRALGREYVGVRHRDRYENTPEVDGYRLVGVVDGTALRYDPPVAGAPSTLNKGEVRVFETGDPFVVTSQDEAHPFYLGQYMSGCGRYKDQDSLDCRGDPEFVNVIPPAQFPKEHLFFTDPTYPDTHVVLIRRRASDGTFKEVFLDCLGSVSGWSRVGDFEWTRLDLVRDFDKQSGCGNGRHELHSSAGVGLTVWGWGSQKTQTNAVSYAYPGTALATPLNTVVVPPVPK